MRNIMKFMPILLIQVEPSLFYEADRKVLSMSSRLRPQGSARFDRLRGQSLKNNIRVIITHPKVLAV